MNNKTLWSVSKYKKLALLMAVFGSGGYLLTPPNIAFAANDDEGESKELIYDDEIFPPEYLDLNQFVVTADRTPVNKWATPANVITITDKDIEANHYQNLAEALNHVNGIIVPSLINVPIINGFEKVLILVDGHQLYNDGVGYRDTVELSAIPSMKNIKRIEIVKGGGSALYGSDAVTGIINIITKKGEINQTTLDVNVGSWRQRNYELTNQGVRGDFSWFITGGVHESNPFNYNSNVARGKNPESRESDKSDKDFTARFDYRFDDRNSITLSGSHISHKYNRYYRYYEEGEPFNRDKSMTYNDIMLVYNFKENTQAPGWLRYFNDTKTREGMDVARSDYNYFINGKQDGFDNDKISKFRVQGVDYQNSWIFGQNKIVAGLEWHQTKMEHWSWNGSEKLTNKALYVQDTISMGKKWKLVPGFRYDHNSEFGHQWSPKIAANYRADDQTKFYASWGRVFKAATPYQLYSVRLKDNDGYFYGNEGSKNLKPEKGNTAILGVEHDFGTKSGINANVFYADINNAIDWKSYNDRTHYVDNIKKEKSYGFEVTFKQKMNEDWSYDVGYNFTKVKGFDEVAGSFHQPRNTLNAGFHYNHGIWQANLFGRIVQGGLDSKSFDSKNFIILDFNVNCNLHENATVYLKLNNLTNKNYSYYAKTSDYTFVSPGRSFIIGADFKF